MHLGPNQGPNPDIAIRVSEPTNILGPNQESLDIEIRVLESANIGCDVGTEGTAGPSGSKVGDGGVNKPEASAATGGSSRIEKPHEVISFEAAKEVPHLHVLLLSQCYPILASRPPLKPLGTQREAGFAMFWLTNASKDKFRALSTT